MSCPSCPELAPFWPALKSLLPPLVAIGVAFWSRQALLALLAGSWLGSCFLEGGLVAGSLRLLDRRLLGAAADPEHAAILIFTVLLGGMVGVVTRSGALARLVDRLSGKALTPRSGQLAAWGMGLAIFFDDYANTLLVGQAMRPVTDRLKVSREKLAYIVDSTSAPVAVLAPLSTWAAYEIGLIAQAYRDLGLPGDPYGVFMRTIPYRFYAVLTLYLVAWIAWTGKDWGPMLKAERRARREGKVLADGAKPMYLPEPPLPADRSAGPWAGLAPIVLVVLATMAGLYLDGRAALGAKAAEVHWVDVLGAANALRVLLWAAFAGTVAAVLGTVRVLKLEGALEAWQEGAKSMLPALMILILAWVLGGLCKELDTAGTVARWTSGCSPAFIPVSTFALAGFIAFITGTSWGTMAILFPIAVPIGSAGGEPVLLATIGAVLAGSTFGDHCSPISDTTILSSTGSACDHMDHVRTQMPYALAAGSFSALLCYLPAGFGWGPWLCTALGLSGLTAYAWLRGRPV